MRHPALMALLILALPPLASAQPGTPDCDAAVQTCQRECGKEHWFDQVEATDFQKQCASSCNEGYKSCKVQDSRNACETFDTHCIDACPWTVTGASSGQKHSNEGSFGACMDACEDSVDSCSAAQKNMPPRRRTGAFDPCKEAQNSCYASCAYTTIEHDGEH